MVCASFCTFITMYPILWRIYYYFFIALHWFFQRGSQSYKIKNYVINYDVICNLQFVLEYMRIYRPKNAQISTNCLKKSKYWPILPLNEQFWFMSTFSFCTVSIFWCVCVLGRKSALCSAQFPRASSEKPAEKRRGLVRVCVRGRALSWHTDNVNVMLCCNAAVCSTVSVEEIERLKQNIFIIRMISQYKSDLVHGSWQLALQKGWCSYC